MAHTPTVITGGSSSLTVGGGATTLFTQSTAGTYAFHADFNTSAIGDFWIVTYYLQVRSTGDGGALRQVDQYEYDCRANLWLDKALPSISFMSPHSFRVTLEQVAGTSHAVVWELIAA